MALQIGGFHAVTPKKDCPHCTEENIAPKEAFAAVHVNDPCPDCQHSGENWVCLKPDCMTVRCSRYVKSHMVTHNQQNQDHPICFSFADFSFWCYACDSYIEHPLLTHTKAFYLQKFGEDDGQKEVFDKMRASKHQEQIREEDEDEDEDAAASASQAQAPEEEKKDEEPGVDALVEGMKGLNVKEPGNFTYEDMVSGIKDGTFKNILVMTGAGISVSAGIPDFRSPGTGVYDNLKEYNLPRPEALFTIDYFLDNPEPFYKFAQNFDLTKFNATPTHYFIKLLQDKGLLWRNMTQNIDNLEEKTGMDMGAVLQAHGANRGAACAACKKEHDFEVLQQAIRDQNIIRCSSCDKPVKPNIVFFGEALPQEFMITAQQVPTEVDLLIVMGTALAVSPFNMLPRMVGAQVPKVLFNMENTKETGGYDFTEENTYKHFVQGKCDETVRKLVADLDWTAEFEAVLPECHKQAAQTE